ncbi:MAG: DUF697 domain-containing protein [Saprospiraceae bacterium]|nr:DUF697 domain-containing protein [Bacteroidia bacterium]NNF21426.1 DUF697 domain-containing protein [Saprospiraceae bacterium]
MEEGKKIKDPRIAHSNSIIKNHMIWSMGAGFIPVPVADFFAVSAIQLDMIRQLSKIYEINFKETEGKAVISALTGSGIARIGARAIKFIPGIGSVLGGVTLAVLSGASTYALGEVFKKHFETGGTFLDFDPSRLKKYYDEKFEKGKQMAKDMEKSQRKNHEEAESVSDEAKAIVLDENEDVIGKLKELNELKKDGVITEEEFEKLKKDLIA